MSDLRPTYFLSSRYHALQLLLCGCCSACLLYHCGHALFLVWVAATECFILLGGMVCCHFLTTTDYYECITVLLKKKSAGWMAVI